MKKVKKDPLFECACINDGVPLPKGGTQFAGVYSCQSSGCTDRKYMAANNGVVAFQWTL